MMSTVSSFLELAPSELILLNGEKFAREVGALKSRVELLHNGLKVSAEELSKAALAAAILANERAGNVVLQPGTAKSFFGLRTTQTLYAAPGTGQVPFPEYSLEARLCQLVKDRQGAALQVNELVYELLIQDMNDVWQWTLGLVQGGLANRNILAVEQNKHLGVFTRSSYRLPEANARMVAAYPLGYVNAALSETAQTRPQLWQTLHEQINKGLSRRRANDSGGDSGAGVIGVTMGCGDAC
jgi:hypothetical protein